MNEQIKTPASDHYEKSVLSGIMRNGLDVEGAENVTPEHFFNPAHRLLYREIVDMDTFPLDGTELLVRANQKGFLESVGGASAIASFGTYCPNNQEFSRHVQKLHSLKAKRIGIDRILEALPSAQDLEDDETFFGLIASMANEVQEAAEATKKVQTKKGVMKEVMRDFEQSCQDRAHSMGMRTGFPCIDRNFRGFHPGQMVVIGGLPSAGKTLLANQIAWNVATGGTPALLISMEMSARDLAKRNTVLASRMPAQAFFEPIKYAETKNNSKPTKDHLRAINGGVMDILKYPIEFENAQNPKASALISIIRRRHRKDKTALVVVDYLQKISGESGNSMERNLANACDALQGLAQELDICLVLLSQLNKEGGTKHAEAITESADLSLNILRNMEPGDDFLKHEGVLVRKDRHHGKGGLILPLYPNLPMLRFEEKTEKHNEH